MKPQTKRKIFIILLSVWLILLAYLIDISLAATTSYKWQIIVALALLTIIFSMVYFGNKFKKKVVPTVEERAMPLEKYVEFNNTFDWFGFCVWSIANLIIWPMANTIDSSSHISIKYSILEALLFMVIFSPAFLLTMRNKYIIDYDTLVVEEYDLCKKTTDMRIPFSAISKVYVSDLYSIVPKVVIVVDGIERKLRSTTHTLELATAIAVRLEK